MSFLFGEKEEAEETLNDRMWELLKDGEYHKKQDIADELGCSLSTVPKVICQLRQDRLPEGELIICEYVLRATGYRRVTIYKDDEFKAPFPI